MSRAIVLLLAMASCSSAQAGELDGHYRTTLDGQPSELILRQNDAVVEGEYVESQHLRLVVKGRYDGKLLRAEISDPQSGLLLANMNATYANAMLNASIAARNPRNGEVLERQALFQREAAIATPPTSGTMDPTLVGTWVHEKIINSGGTSFASFNTLMTLQLNADGSVTQWSRAVGGGGDWSYDSPGEVQYSGHWRSQGGMLMVRLAGAADYQPAAYYRFSDQYLVTESNTGKMIWQRRR
ncbi:hypothetical protein N5E99_22305 [Pseudomonas chengduensis]|uniref:Uncharacterized protein n=1 Tax=Ectopseudomonas chengduensis TaxID=489632 RepID=A0A1G6U7W5_9GAMM|nr:MULTISPECIES: hypothetical protein [Pseudomonas]KQO28442.1 hypothetical protein ASF15_15185 [Pseudomonas sp. Leaf83]MBP3063083.1 hypothetical protein [Pseudomonas chengduensis]MDH0960392.1 hypothetical protein [Pseudomonas chengduensis]MDH1538489.1 hypothetical protein [Pseudomonas chengduensis]NNB76723.1 hypothetical protein [Pseudomonas chengduensis]